MAKQKWDCKMVEARLEEAAGILQRLPEEKLRGMKSNWPETLPSREDYDLATAKQRLGPPSPEAIDQMDEAMEWLRWLEPEDIRLLWFRAEKIPWKIIMRQFGLARSTITARWKSAVSQIVTILNLPKKVSVHLSAGHFR
jgi:hypothetical protein